MPQPLRQLISLLALILLPIVARANLRTVNPPPLLLISIDGYRADYIGRSHSPNLARLAAEGVHARGLRPAFPSMTYPNHYTLVTGLYPDRHGMVNNTMRDPVLGEFSPPNRAANTDGRWWDQAEPLWVSAEKAGIRTASVFWPGTQAQIRGVRPTYWQSFDPKVSPDERVDQVLAWLDLPPGQRPTFISLYFEQADVAAHNHGPDSPEVNEALEGVDAALGRLLAGLQARGVLAATNIVIVSDHGMAATSSERMIWLEDLVSPDHLTIISGLVDLGLVPRPGFEQEVEKALLGSHPHLQCWKKEQLPARWHYGHNPRIPPIQCVAESGWMVSTHEAEAKRTHALLGEHGYDNRDPDMLALFVAHGPAFKQHLTVPVFDNIHVYGLLAKVLHVRPLPNDGSPAVMAPMLKPGG